VSGKRVIMRSGTFDVRLKDGAMISLKRVGDLFDTEYIWPGKRFGDVFVSYRHTDGDWQRVSTRSLAERNLLTTKYSHNGEKQVYTAGYFADDRPVPDIAIGVLFETDGDSLIYTVSVQNHGERELEIGDLAIPFPMNSSFEWGTKPVESVIRHSFVSGDGSYMFWMRCNGAGPYLAMTPLGHSKFEYYDMFEMEDEKPGTRQYRAYVHSKAQGSIAAEKGCRWRQPHTGVRLAPRGEPGDKVSYPFKFQWAADYEHMRQIIVDEGLIDIEAVPGMTVPNDQFALFSLRTKQPIHAVVPEFPEHTDLSFYKKHGEVVHIYKVRFGKLGENAITVHYGDGKSVLLEFFSTEPVETLIKKRAAFIARHQHRDPSKWYNGLFAEWNMETGTMLGPDNYDRIKGWRIYAVTCDDPGLSKPAFLSSKNAEYPVQEEVKALEYYIEHFVWGGLQRTDREEFAYGIYGIPDWHALRNSEDDGPGGKLHIWRIYDYPHIFLLYWNMYKIGKNHPEIRMKLPKETYLERAYRTALAMFTVPMEIADWSAYKTGLYNELVIEDIVEELYRIGWKEKAYRLERHWIKKVRSFVKEQADVFGSEYPFDSTGFESTHALAKSALNRSVWTVEETPAKHGEPAITYNESLAFLEAQIWSNIACRGWLEPAYYLYGSDYRASGNAAYTLSYMSQMGGCSILDYALHFSRNPYPLLRLGYASLLSSWALMNTGTPESRYGYWYPGEEHDGAAGGGFEPSPFGVTWLGQEHHRGAWYYACEIDLGYCGAMRGAATVLADDPVFGLYCYGGEYRRVKGGYEVTMKDGVRRRLHVLLGDKAAGLSVDTDHISSSKPVFVKADLSEIAFHLESDVRSEHAVALTVSRLPVGRYKVFLDSAPTISFQGGEHFAKLPLTVTGISTFVRIAKEMTPKSWRPKA